MRKIILTAILLALPLVCFGQEDTVIDKNLDKLTLKIEELSKQYKDANPEEDAKTDFSNKTIRFMSVCGYACLTPGIEDSGINIDEYEVYIIPETSDAILSDAHAQFQAIANEYAKRYNIAMLELIRNQDLKEKKEDE